MCERFFQLFEFLCRPMQFYPGEIGHGEHFREQRTDVFQMSENALGAFVSFTAANFVAIDAEAVEKIVFSVAVFSTNCGNADLTSSSFPGCTLK